MRFLLLVTVLVLFNSCVQELDIFKKAEKLLIIDGAITDKATAHVVKLNYTRPYNTGPNYSEVGGALVEIVDDLGTREVLTYRGKDRYTTDTTFKGTIGRAYHVEVVLNSGKKYSSQPEVLLPVAPVEEAHYDRELVQLLSEDDVLYTTPKIIFSIKFTDTPNEQNFYRWRFTGTYQVFSPEADNWPGGGGINRSCPQISNGQVLFRANRDCWITDFDLDYLRVESDDLFEGRQVEDLALFSFDIDNKFAIGYHINIQQQSISKQAYEYLEALRKQISNKGTIFETANYQIVGNIRSEDNPDELVLGYFSASAVAETEVFVNAKDLPDDFPEKDCQPNNVGCMPVTCIDCLKYSNLSSNIKPDFWPLP